MKELLIKEKAKAYDGLIERLKDLKFAYRFSPLSDTIEEKFPELKESEDERIREALIKASNYDNPWTFLDKRGITKADIIAWLEKKGEHNPAWSEKDIFKVQRICKYLDNAKKYYADITEVRECIDWLKSLKDRTQPQWKPSKEQMKQLNSAANIYPDSRIGHALRSLYQDLVTYM